MLTSAGGVELSAKSDLKKLLQVAFGGALVSKSGAVIGHANNPTALAGDIGGFAGLGVASAVGNAAFDVAWTKRRIRKAKYRHKEKKSGR